MLRRLEAIFTLTRDSNVNIRSSLTRRRLLARTVNAESGISRAWAAAGASRARRQGLRRIGQVHTRRRRIVDVAGAPRRVIQASLAAAWRYPTFGHELSQERAGIDDGRGRATSEIARSRGGGGAEAAARLLTRRRPTSLAGRESSPRVRAEAAASSQAERALPGGPGSRDREFSPARSGRQPIRPSRALQGRRESRRRGPGSAGGGGGSPSARHLASTWSRSSDHAIIADQVIEPEPRAVPRAELPLRSGDAEPQKFAAIYEKLQGELERVARRLSGRPRGCGRARTGTPQRAKDVQHIARSSGRTEHERSRCGRMSSARGRGGGPPKGSPPLARWRRLARACSGRAGARRGCRRPQRGRRPRTSGAPTRRSASGAPKRNRAAHGA